MIDRSLLWQTRLRTRQRSLSEVTCRLTPPIAAHCRILGDYAVGLVIESLGLGIETHCFRNSLVDRMTCMPQGAKLRQKKTLNNKTICKTLLEYL